MNDVLNVSFPRCAVCETDWYDPGGDKDETNSKPAAEGSNTKRQRPSHTYLLPMPPCQCTTRLALPPLPPAVFASQEFRDPEGILSQVNTHVFNHLALCKSCLEMRIETTGHVLKHDYKQDDVENGQRSVKFSVELACTHCHRKFMSRVVERILESAGDAKGSGSGASGKKGEGEANWFECVEATIRLVGFAKREMRRESRRQCQSKLSQGSGDNQSEGFWEQHRDAFTGGDDSDSCYSFSGDESDGANTAKGPRRLEMKSGELQKDLMRKDPKFRQQVEDEEFVKKLLEEEGDQRQRAAVGAHNMPDGSQDVINQLLEEDRKVAEEKEARDRKDREMALKLQKEYDKQNPKIEPVKTRSKRPRPSILDALQKSAKKAAKKPSRERSPVVDLVDDDSEGNARADLKSPPEESPSKSPESSDAEKKPRARKADVPVDESDESDEEEDAVQEVMRMGFSRASAERSLKDAKGNVQLAVSMLLSETTDREG
ncbi:hypothetical protein ACHAXT_009599 [Thalassiosira profunda]